MQRTLPGDIDARFSERRGVVGERSELSAGGLGLAVAVEGSGLGVYNNPPISSTIIWYLASKELIFRHVAL